MAGYRLAPKAARARRNPWQKRRLYFGSPQGASLTVPSLAASVVLAPPTVLTYAPGDLLAEGTPTGGPFGIPVYPSIRAYPPSLVAAVALVAPTVTTTTGGSSVTVTAPALAASAVLAVPTVSASSGTAISGVALAASVALVAPIVSTDVGPGTATVTAPGLLASIVLAAPSIESPASSYWAWARRFHMADTTKTYTRVQEKGTTRTATWTSPTYEARHEAGILVVLDVTAASGTGGLTLRINAHDLAGSVAVPLNTAPTAVTATGTTSYALYPFGAISGAATQSTSSYLPRQFSITVTHGDSSSYTYSVGYCLLP